VIDFDRLEEMFGDDPDLIQSLFDLYISSTVSLLKNLEGAIAARDALVVAALSHEAKGTSVNLGVDRMAHIAANMESACTLPDWSRILLLHSDMEVAFVHVQTALAERPIA
jgi:HPt (histidine-containing phosphotransfer) domain-containing protein